MSVALHPRSRCRLRHDEFAVRQEMRRRTESGHSRGLRTHRYLADEAAVSALPAAPLELVPAVLLQPHSSAATVIIMSAVNFFTTVLLLKRRPTITQDRPRMCKRTIT